MQAKNLQKRGSKNEPNKKTRKVKTKGRKWVPEVAKARCLKPHLNIISLSLGSLRCSGVVPRRAGENAGEVIVVGMVTAASEVHLVKAAAPIVVTPLGMITEESEVHS